jgi:hypothetical protein
MPRNSLDHGASPSRAHLLESQLTTPTSDIASLSPKTIDLEGRESPSEQHEPVAGFASCSINLLKTILGAGMLAMPFAFASLGYIPGTVFVLVTAALAAFGLHLFIASSKYVGRGATVNKLANLTYPSLTILFDFAIALKCFGVAISYLIVIGDMMPSIINGLGIRNSLFLSRQFWLMLSAIPLVPLAFLKRMDSLKYTSFAGLLSVLYLVGVAAWNVWKPDAIRPPPDAGIEPFASFSFASIKSFSVFVFSFTCHQNVPRDFYFVTKVFIDLPNSKRGKGQFVNIYEPRHRILRVLECNTLPLILHNILCQLWTTCPRKCLSQLSAG